jgi:hypothetical protein
MQSSENVSLLAQAPLPEAVLARRWQISVRTLQRWRRAGTGPAWLLIGRSVFYRPEDIEAYEVAARRQGTGQ